MPRLLRQVGQVGQVDQLAQATKHPVPSRRRVALVTCAAFPALHDDDRRLLGPLEEAGFVPEPVRWDDRGARWEDYEAAILRSTWDYYERAAEFRAWLDRLEARSVRLLNSAETVRGNFDKHYLRDLAERGVPTVPTVWVERDDTRPVADVLAGVPWDEVVVKPAVSAGAYRTHRTTRAALLGDDAALREAQACGGALLQPFLPEIVSQGEWSFIYLGGRLSHAVVKQAKDGDFRVQWTHGGRHAARTPSAALVSQVDLVARHVPVGCLFARIDGIELSGRFTLMELELIEPYLFLGEAPGAAVRFAQALRATLG